MPLGICLSELDTQGSSINLKALSWISVSGKNLGQITDMVEKFIVRRNLEDVSEIIKRNQSFPVH